MSLDLHRQAEHFMGESDMALSAGNYAKAAAAIARAGQLEAEVFELIPVERAKTRGIVAVSACSAFLQAAHHATLADDLVAAATFRNAAQIAIKMYLKVSLPDWALERLTTLEADTDAEYARRVAK